MSFNRFNSRRSTVYSTKGMVASSQPLASAAGVKILEKGGNAIDAAIAVAAVLGVTEVASTDLGGDAYCIFYDAGKKKCFGLNGTGRSGAKVSLDLIKKTHPQDIQNDRLSIDSVFSCNVPGCVAAWYDAYTSWGSGQLAFADLLQPAIDLAENGFPIHEISAALTANTAARLKQNNAKQGEQFLRDELALFLPGEGLAGPAPGTLMKNRYLAETLKTIAKHGKDGFYKGAVAQSIVDELASRGGVLTMDDLASHTSTFVEPISMEFLGKKLWEIPPNGSGIIALLTLGLIKQLCAQGDYDLAQLKHNSAEYLHLLIESLKLSFKDSEEYVSDPKHLMEEFHINSDETIEKLLHSDYFKERCKLVKKDAVLDNKILQVGQLPGSIHKSDTVYFSVTDKHGNAASFINSVYHNFGSGILVPQRGFFLQNRGANFTMKPGSKNFIRGGKRSYHTIIPGLITTPLADGSEELYAAYGIQGGFNQPQAHVQVYLNMLLFGFTPQEALDAPRISLSPHPDYLHTNYSRGAEGPVSTEVTLVNIETGVDPKVVDELRALGHDVRVLSGFDRKMFGRGQIIRRQADGVYAAGSDQRGDGAAMPVV